MTNFKIGDDALLSNVEGIDNTAVGVEALMNTEGSGNTAVGNRAGKLTENGDPLKTANSSTFIGDDTKALEDGSDNETVIGDGAVGSGKDSVTIGNDDVKKTVLKGIVFMDGGTKLSKSENAPVNAVAARAGLVVTSRPADFVKMVKSSKQLAVASQPNVLTKASGTITISGTPIAEESFQVGEDTYTFKAEPSVDKEIAIDADNSVQAGLIEDAINTFSVTCEAEASGDVVTVRAKTGGTAGNDLVLTENATGVAVSAGGKLSGGLAADTLVLDEGEAGEITYTFVANGTTDPAETDIVIGTDVAGTAAAIVAKAMPETLTCVFVSPASVKFTAVADGTAGDGITINSDGTRISGDGNTAGGVDEVKSYLTINGIEYIFANSAGDDPESVYPECRKVATAGGATTSEIATALKAALILDTTAFTSASVTVATNTLLVKYKIKGSAGNEITYVNNLLTEGDITDDLTDGTLKDAIDGTPGYAGMVTLHGLYLYLCTVDDYTTGQDGWVRSLFATY